MDVGLALLRCAPGHPLDVRAADADVGELTVAESVKLVQAAVIALPRADEADDIAKHGSSSFFGPCRLGTPVNLVARKIGMFS